MLSVSLLNALFTCSIAGPIVCTPRCLSLPLTASHPHLICYCFIQLSVRSGVRAGWGWGESSYIRNINTNTNSITKIMQRLADGVYTKTPCCVHRVPHALACAFVLGGRAIHVAYTYYI